MSIECVVKSKRIRDKVTYLDIEVNNRVLQAVWFKTKRPHNMSVLIDNCDIDTPLHIEGNYETNSYTGAEQLIISKVMDTIPEPEEMPTEF